MIFCILDDAACERGNVRMAMSLPFARTVICALFACITKPSNLSRPVGLGLGFTTATTIGAAVSTTIGTITGACAAAGQEKKPASASISGSPMADILTILFIPYRPWQSARTLEIAHPGASWPAAGPAFCHALPKTIPDPPESAATPESGGPGSSAWLPRPPPHRVLPARWWHPASARYRTREHARRQSHP